ncbi:MAG: hypothetical protein JSS68_18780 [Actinobacteria bacterium]|nr:hypothetical protein [Actinomycetota bacterium]
MLSSVLAAALLAAPSIAAPAPVVLGQVGSASTTEGATGWGGCKCTVAQMQSPTGSPYTIPYDGVIVSSGTYVGTTVEAGDTVQVQTVHKTGATTGTVVSEGTPHGLLSLPTGAVSRFLDRLPAHAGDVLAARFHDSPLISSTAYFFKSTSAADETEFSEPAVAPGGSLAGNPTVAQRRVNLEAVLEPDEDQDGYGDDSQDLCPGSPIATTACSGSLFGSDLQGERSAKPLSCSCMYVQTSLGGASTAASSPGVIVRWRVLNGGSGAYRIHVLTDNPGGSGGAFRAFHVLGTSDTVNVTAPINPVFSQIASFPTRLPIPVGGYVGLTVPGGSVPSVQSSPGGQATYARGEAPFPGVTGVVGETHNGMIMYDADIEPDVDGDGYGDVTQDSCPSSASVHEGPCPTVVPPGGGAGAGGAQAPTASTPPDRRPLPIIRSLEVRPRRFRAKPLGGVPASGDWGAKVTLSLSTPATVTLAIETKHGHHFQVVTRLTKKAAAGRTSVGFNGQYHHGGKLVDLSPGAYRLTARATAGGGTGPVKHTTFTVLPSA